MCTVSFIARQKGYLLGMNRDEKLTRAPGLPPKLLRVQGRRVIQPSERGGGTWIALNESGATLALINWYSISARVKTNPVSRGEVVKAASFARAPEEVESELAKLLLRRINPFRLIGIFLATSEVAEWRWDLKKLVRRDHAWETQQWISSGFDEPEAQRVRSRTFSRARKQITFASVDWLRRLHRSHGRERGPFSTCMHRVDAATVSYTEVSVSGTVRRMSYHAGPPCELRASKTVLLKPE
ncbi:MAG: hypothetical protein EPO07_12655 [Verrucomicrobia bacterium]|nr:MAG: hypothetical protein EPO07_12655 [Verrucomicrobiota bacterium]